MVNNRLVLKNLSQAGRRTFVYQSDFYPNILFLTILMVHPVRFHPIMAASAQSRASPESRSLARKEARAKAWRSLKVSCRRSSELSAMMGIVDMVDAIRGQKP